MIIGILLIPVRGRAYLKYENDDFTSDFELRLFFIRIKPPKKKQDKEEERAEAPAEPKEKDGGRVWNAVTTIKEHIPEIKKLISEVLKYLYKHLIKIKSIELRGEFGVDDAMQTALLYGAVSAFIYNLAGVMDEYMRLGKCEIDIKPDFNDPHISAELMAIISTNIFHLIIILAIAAKNGVPLIIKIRKSKKEKNDG